MKNFFSSIVTLVMLSLFAVSCGKSTSNVLDGVKVSTSQVDNQTWLSFAAELNLGAMSFSSISVPVFHPDSQAQIGQLELTSELGGKNQLKISVNLSEVADIEQGVSLLPNGNLIPLIASNPTIVINVGSGAKVYLTISEAVSAIGVAVPISAFDGIGRSLPGLNIFPVVTQGNVTATAGIFTSSTAGQNGIAVVADVSKAVNLGDLFQSSTLMAKEAEEAQSVMKLDYRSHKTSSAKKEKLDEMIYKLNKKKAVLKMH